MTANEYQHLIQSFVSRTLPAADFERASMRVVQRIETALHPAFVSVLVHHPDEPEYRAVATYPKHEAVPHLTGVQQLPLSGR